MTMQAGTRMWTLGKGNSSSGRQLGTDSLITSLNKNSSKICVHIDISWIKEAIPSNLPCERQTIKLLAVNIYPLFISWSSHSLLLLK